MPVAAEMYYRVINMLDEMEIIEDEEVALPDDSVDVAFEICTYNSDKEEEEE